MAGCADQSVTPVEPLAEVGPAAPLLTEIRLPLAEIGAPFRWDDEFRGLSTMAVELGLSDLPGVVVRIPGHSAPPSVLVSLPVSRRLVDARLVVRPLPKVAGVEATPLELELELCVAGGACASTTTTGTREAPWDALGALLEGAAEALDVTPDDATVAGWHTPGSADTYAELLTGRAAATLYGILPPPEEPEDKRSNPVLRAVLIDPRQPLALWTLARWQVGYTSDGGAAADTLARASLARPWSPLFDADLATVLHAAGKHDQAVLAWEHLRESSPQDPRYLEPAAQALMAAGRPEDARAVLREFPGEFRWTPRVAELSVVITEAIDGSAGLDPLLAHWQQTDPKAVAPVRRRLDLRVQSGQFADALEILPALRTRAPGPQTDALEVALLVATGRLEDAVAHAPADVGARIGARAEREQDPGAPLPELDASPDADLARAEGLLWRGEPASAMPLLTAARKERPWRADLHAALARALEGVGRGEDAAAAWQTAWELDPAMNGGPVSAGRVASTFQLVVREPAPEDAVDSVGAMGPDL
jgi:tetratricopeptide (TPR) repeat protein